MKTTIVVAMLLLSCVSSSRILNSSCTLAPSEESKVYFTRPIAISSTHQINTVKVNNAGPVEWETAVSTDAHSGYKETCDAFCRDMRFVAAEKNIDWMLIPEKFRSSLNSLFLDTNRIIDTLPEPLLKNLAIEQIEFLVIFHNFRSNFVQIQKQQGIGISTPHPIYNKALTEPEFKSKIAMQVSLFHAGTKICSFNLGEETGLSLEPVCRKVFKLFNM